MKKYFVFRHDKPLQTPYPHGSYEAVACEIARLTSNDMCPIRHYSACELGSQEATFYGLQSELLCTLYLDKKRLDLWENEISLVEEHLSRVQQALEQSRYTISDTLDELLNICENSESVKDLDLGKDIDVDSGFSTMEPMPLTDFYARVGYLFDVRFPESAEQD